MKRSSVLGLLMAAPLCTGLYVSTAYPSERQTTTNQASADRKVGTETRTLNVGDNAWDEPTAALPSLDGPAYALDRWSGKVVLLNFWASWCAPCQYEIPELIRLQERHGAEGLQIVGIGLDTERRLRNVSRSLGINYPVLLADGVRGQHLLERWGNGRQIVPYNVVIARDGRIAYTHLGKIDQEVFDAYIAPLLTAP